MVTAKEKYGYEILRRNVIILSLKILYDNIKATV